jgi:hypothetical protein
MGRSAVISFLVSSARTDIVEHPVPLRLMGRQGRQGAFYSNVWGFLPYHIGTEPIDRFHLLEVKKARNPATLKL